MRVVSSDGTAPPGVENATAAISTARARAGPRRQAALAWAALVANRVFGFFVSALVQGVPCPADPGRTDTKGRPPREGGPASGS